MNNSHFKRSFQALDSLELAPCFRGGRILLSVADVIWVQIVVSLDVRDDQRRQGHCHPCTRPALETKILANRQIQAVLMPSSLSDCVTLRDLGAQSSRFTGNLNVNRYESLINASVRSAFLMSLAKTGHHGKGIRKRDTAMGASAVPRREPSPWLVSEFG